MVDFKSLLLEQTEETSPDDVNNFREIIFAYNDLFKNDGFVTSNIYDLDPILKILYELAEDFSEEIRDDIVLKMQNWCHIFDCEIKEPITDYMSSIIFLFSIGYILSTGI